MKPATIDDGQLVHKALRRACQTVGITHADAAQIIGVSRSVLSRASGRLSGKPMEAALLLLRVIRSLDGVIGGNHAHAQHWMNTHNNHLHGVPVERMQKTEGLIAVASYLDIMRGKA